MKKMIALILCMMTALICAMPALAAEDYDQVIVFVHTNDVHGYVDIYAYLPAVVADMEAQYGEGNVILASAGDEWAGLNIATLSKGENIVPIMNAAGYQVMALGNNDQNFGLEQMLALAEESNFPVLCANLVETATGNTLLPSTTTFDCNGVKIGIFGICPTMPEKDGTETTDGYTAAASCVASLEAEGCDLIVALTHIGYGDNYEVSSDKLSEQVSGIDLIIDGHSHTVLENGYVSSTGVLVSQTGEYGNNIGITKLYLKDGAVVKADTQLISSETYTANYPADTAVQAIIAEKNAALEEVTSEVVGHTDVLLDGSRPGIRSSETNLGSLCADALRWKTGADIALLPGVLVRASVEPGDITLGDTLNVFSIGGTFYCEQLTGAQIKSLLTGACAYLPEQDMRYQHVSGMTYTYSISESGNVIESMTLADGTPITDDGVYTVAFDAIEEVLGLDIASYTLILEGQAEAADMLKDYIQSEDFVMPTGKEGRAVQVPAAAAVPDPVAENQATASDGASAATDIIVDTPAGNLPQTGTASQDAPVAVLLSISGLLALAGIASLISRKKAD